MPLGLASLNITAGWTLNKTNAGQVSTSQGPDSQSFNWNGISVSTFNQIYVTGAVTVTGTTMLDLTNLTNLVSENFGFGHVLGYMVQPSTNPITVGAGSFSAPFNTSGTATIPAGGCQVFAYPATGPGWVVNTSNRYLQLVAPSGTSTVELLILGSTS